MSTSKPTKMLLKGIAELQYNGDHSDFTIACGSDIYKVHKAIVCSQSEFFRLAFRSRNDPDGDFQEAKTGTLELPCRSAERPEDFKWDPDADDARCIKHMVHYFYHLDYLEVETAKIKKQKRANEDFDKNYTLADGILIEHAKMYAIGDKYGISGLKKLALEKYEEAYRFTSAGFSNSVIVAFTSTVDSDMDLRHVIINILHQDLVNLLSKPQLDQVVKDVLPLSHALLRKELGLPA